MFIAESPAGRFAGAPASRRPGVARLIRPTIALAATIGILGGLLSVVSDGQRAAAESAGADCMATEMPGRRCGYITVPGVDGGDSAELFYQLRLPTRAAEVPGQPGTSVTVELPGPFPTLLSYQGYGSSPGNNAGDFTHYVREGYALMVMTVRGTGCSSGVWDPFSPQEAEDAKYVIDEWIAKQPWSNGRVAMVGVSYAGITQPPVAATRPKHLVAIAPGLPLGDLYRDAVYPGGIFNPGIVSFFSAFQGQASASYAGTETAARERGALWTDCAARQASRLGNAQHAPALQWSLHPYDGHFWRARLAAHRTDEIKVPVFLTSTWQDQVVGGRAIESLSGIAKLHGILSNGGHLTTVELSDLAKSQLSRFLAHYVKGEQNGFGDEPRIQVWWETGRDGVVAPGWRTYINQWPAPQAKAERFFLSGNGTTPATGKLEVSPGAVTGYADPYVYAGPSGQSALPTGSSAPAGSWSVPPKPGASLTYTTAPLTEDKAVLGSASLNLWLAASAPDTDLQVTLSEVRDYGGIGGLQEVFVQQGWLRASHRAEDPARSRETMPYHPHEGGEPLELGVADDMRVEILPFAHLFRKGSRIRVTIEAPKGVNDAVWSFDSHHPPSVNTIYHDATHQSQLVLPVLPPQSGTVPTYPQCGTVADQPCRPVAM